MVVNDRVKDNILHMYFVESLPVKEIMRHTNISKYIISKIIKEEKRRRKDERSI